MLFSQPKKTNKTFILILIFHHMTKVQNMKMRRKNKQTGARCLWGAQSTTLQDWIKINWVKFIFFFTQATLWKQCELQIGRKYWTNIFV